MDLPSWGVKINEKYFFLIFSKSDQNFGLKYFTNYSDSTEQPQTPLRSFEVLNKNIQKKQEGGWIVFEILEGPKYFTWEKQVLEK